MKNIITITLFLTAGTLFANAGTTYWWEGGKTNGLQDHEFGAVDGTKTNWSTTGGDSWVLPEAYDTYEALQTAISSGSYVTKETAGNSPTDGIDFTFGGDSTTVNVNKYYYVSGLMDSGWSYLADYTFNFGETGAIYSRWQTNFSYYFKSLTLNVTLSGSGERVLFGTSGLSYSNMYVSDAFMKSATLIAAGYSVINTFYTDATIGELSLSAGQAALYYSASKNTISVKYLALPEPSAFGLLAGLGVLALAGTRRRRKSK